VQVENEGGTEADEVVQVYVTANEPKAPAPLRALKGFQRVTLQPGEKRVVRLSLDERAFSLVATDGQRLVEPGRYTVAVGGKQPGLTGTADARTTMVLTANVEITGAAKTLAP
jgi:beta-glucosidase